MPLVSAALIKRQGPSGPFSHSPLRPGVAGTRARLTRLQLCGQTRGRAGSRNPSPPGNNGQGPLCRDVSQDAHTASPLSPVPMTTHDGEGQPHWPPSFSMRSPRLTALRDAPKATQRVHGKARVPGSLPRSQFLNFNTTNTWGQSNSSLRGCLSTLEL